MIARELEALAERGGRQGDAVADLAILDLLRERPNEAERRLRMMARLHPKSAKTQSDLAATCLYLAKAEGKPSHLVEAFIAAERAIRLDVHLPEARFNYALVAERLFLRAHARQAWERYLALKDSSEWREVAQRHWYALSREGRWQLWELRRQELDAAALRGDHVGVRDVVAEFQQRARLYAQEELLGQWGQAQLEGNTAEALRRITVARTIGRALADLPSGDLTVTDSVIAIDSLRRTPQELHSLAEAHALYAAGLTAYRLDKTGEAQRLFAASLSGFLATRSPMRLWASFDLARCDYRATAYDRLFDRLGRLMQDTALERYPALAARALWTMGLAQTIQGRFERSLQDYVRALELASRCGEMETVASVHGLLAENFRLLGESRRAWRHLHAALEGSLYLQDPARLHAVLDEATLQAVESDSSQLALLFQTEALPAVRKTGNTSAIALAHHRRASLHEQLGDLSAAARDLEACGHWLELVEDEGSRESLRGDFLIVAARLEAQRATTGRAIDLLNGAVATYEETGYVHPLPELLRERARAKSAAGNDAGAIRDLEASLQLIESIREGTPGGDLRAGYLNQVEETFEEMVRLQVRSGAAATALNYAERGRSRLLLDLVHSATDSAGLGQSMQALNTNQLQRALPGAVTLIFYHVHRDHLYIWAMSRTRLQLEVQTVDESELVGTVRRFRNLILQGSPSLNETAELLYQLLLGPVAGALRSAKTLVFVPDGVLYQLPFAALRNPATGKYVVEDFPSAISYSGSLHVHGLAKRLPAQGNAVSLFVGNPTFDKKEWPWLRPLPGAEREAEGAATWMPHSVLLTQRGASKFSLLKVLRQARFFYIASHVVLNRELPLRSGFVLAATPQDPQALLTAADLYRADLDHLELVTLASCSTAEGKGWGQEGIANLARPFLAAGVPSVIASLWPVQDGGSTFSIFYQHLRDGISVANALRLAQLEQLTKTSPEHSSVRRWASLELISSGARSWSSRHAT